MSTTLEKPAALIAAIILAMLSCVALPAMSRAAEPSAAPEGICEVRGVGRAITVRLGRRQ